jgi:hypothetical protein
MYNPRILPAKTSAMPVSGLKEKLLSPTVAVSYDIVIAGTLLRVGLVVPGCSYPP